MSLQWVRRFSSFASYPLAKFYRAAPCNARRFTIMSAVPPTIDLISRRDATPPTNIVEQFPTEAPEIPAKLPAPRQRFVFLDGLRGIACLRIVGVHFFNE